MNWVSKLDDVVTAAKDGAVLYWEFGVALALIGAAMALIIGLKQPSKEARMRSKARQLRYCHDCQYNDLLTEACAIDAAAGEKCGLIDQTAGMTFTTPTKG